MFAMYRNVINVGDIEDFLRSFAGENDAPRLGDYMVVALGKSILKEDRFFEPVVTYPDPAPEWLTQEKFANGSFEIFKSSLTRGSSSTLRQIKDWINGALKENDPWVNDLDALGRSKKLLNISSLGDANYRADKARLQKSRVLCSRFSNAANHFEGHEKEGHIKTFKVFDDGSRVVQLLTPYALRAEALLMGLCIGDDGYVCKLEYEEDCKYYSLRDARNHPHVTMEVEGDTLIQCKGKGDVPPVSKYMPPIYDFLDENELGLDSNVGSTGIIKRGDEYFDVRDLPRFFEHEGGLFFNNISKWQLNLPDGLVVHGDLAFLLCGGVDSLPDGLVVHGNLDISGCPDLKYLGNNIDVRGKVLWDNQKFDTFDEFREAFERKQYFGNVYCLPDGNLEFE